MIRKNIDRIEQQIRDYWQYRTLRERSIALVVGTITLAACLYLLVLMPAYTYYSDTKALYQKEKNLLAWIEAITPQVKQRSLTPVRSEQSLISVVTEISRQQGVPLVRVEPKDHSVTAWLDATEFDRIIRLLMTLKRDRGIRISHAAIDNTEAPQRAKARVELQWAQ